MKITIDNLDGNGAVDYTAALSAPEPLKIERKLNEPSLCTALLDTADTGLPTPASGARVVVTAKNGASLFTGYVAMQPALEYKGAGLAGSVYLVVVNAVSDDIALNGAVLTEATAVQGQTAGSTLRWTTTEASAATAVSGISDVAAVGVFQREAGRNWSANASAIASMSRASYRVVNGGVSLSPIGGQTHVFSESAGTLNAAALQTSQVKELAKDVTLSGLAEPAEYVTELFQGDGATEEFTLTDVPFKVAKPKLLDESFQAVTFSSTVWRVNDPGQHLTTSSAGLTLSGGTGVDGQTTLTGVNSIELGGEVVVEAGVVTLGAGSQGMLCGLYAGVVAQVNCFAAFSVKQSNGNTTVTPFVNGAEAGTSFQLQAGHTYTLRLHVHCVELIRNQQTYYSQTGAGVQQHGGGLVAAPASLLFELQDSASVAGAASTILYDGSVNGSPALATFAAVNSTNLIGSVGYFRITQPGTAWVTSQPSGGAAYTRRIGLAAEGADCHVLRTGKVRFFKAATPGAGELIRVTYRTSLQSVARIASTAVQSGALPATAYYAGKVLSPPARCSADCENAAAAVLDFSTNPNAAISGKYADVNLQDQGDVWPGDSLTFVNSRGTTQAIARSVQLTAMPSFPEEVRCAIAFANDWAEDLSLKLSPVIAPNAIVPATAASAPGQVAASLPSLSVTSVSASSISVNANVTPPPNRGFEVRRRDGNFGQGPGQDLVMRSPVPNFVLPRAAETEGFFIRMYDGASPPLYSRYSSAIFTDVPTA